MYDYVIVGSGLMGSTFAYLAKQAGKRCLVLEKRGHTGGNIHLTKMNGINVHQYGAHIFHTNNKKVWDFVSQFIELNRFTNSPLANYRGKLYNLPFNMNTFYQMWGVTDPSEAKAIIKSQSNVNEIRNLEDQAIALVGKDIYERLIKGYTEKQWGRSCNELSAFIIRRLPLRFTFDNNYFNDKYQGVGNYNQLIDKLLDDIEVRTNYNFTRHDFRDCRVIYTGPIDAYFSYVFGRLEYRTVEFKTEVLQTPNFQGNAVVNYTDKEVPWTRIIEHKHFEIFGDDVYKNPQTVISKEYSKEWNFDSEPYYPINDERNDILLERYKELARSETNTVFAGRLAEYKYYDMAPTIEGAFKIWKNEK